MSYAEFEHPRPVARLGGSWVEVVNISPDYVGYCNQDGVRNIDRIGQFHDWDIPDQHAEAIAPFNKRKI